MIEKHVIETVLKKCMSLKEDEKILIITDRTKEDISSQFHEIAKTLCKESKLASMPPREKNGEEPTDEIAKLMMEYPVQLIITSKSLSHTGARRNATKNGARLASMPGITEEIINRSIDINYDLLKNVNHSIRDVLIGSSKIHITTPAGTDIVTKVTHTHGENPGIFEKKGDWGNLPSGEVDSGVFLEETNGILVIDGSMAGIGKLDNPLTLKIENGIAVDIQGKEAEKLKEKLDTVGKNAYKIAELGIGTNPNALVTGKVLEDEKALGTFHMALGNDLTYGGNNNVPLHLDGVCKNPTIIVDDKEIMKDGKLLLN